VASTLDTHGGSADDQPFRVEQRGIDYVPESERWATPRNIGALWAGSAINVEYFIYGALLMAAFGFSFKTAVSIIIIGNISFLLLGLASLQGPEAGTTAFAISRAPFGLRGSRLVSFFNWITQIGFETEGLILIVGAAIVLSQMAGFQVNGALKVLYIVIAAAIQAVVPYFGHATMVKVLRALIIPFGAIFVLFAIFDIQHGSSSFKGFGSGWELYTAGLAFVFALSGLGWTECGNDYTRYVPRDASKGSIVGWVFIGTAVPEICMMLLGAATVTFLSSNAHMAAWQSSDPFRALRGQHFIPSWVIVLFLLFAIVQLFGINSLDLYSSGVSLQAMGLRLRRYQAVILDSVLACGLTIWAMFQSTFFLYMQEFVGVIILWIAPWFGVFLMDWILRKFRYNPAELQRTDKNSIYFGGAGGVSWNAIAAFVAGVVCATLCYSKANPPVDFPFHWMTPIANHFGAVCAGNLVHGACTAGWYGGADFSVPTGVIIAGLVYFLLEKATGRVAKQVKHQKELEPNR
jgi:NCS1 family nucleobase:cation symporter-1